ncbi:MAG: hypothetical protein RLY45_437 [Actinomycetota bacterium]
MGERSVRLDVPWALGEPRPGSIDGGVFETLVGTAHRARGLGLETWCRLLQPEVPRWFDNEGGFSDERAAQRSWPRWVDAVADRLGEHIDGWVPIEAPFGAALRLAPSHPRRQGEILHQLVVAWRDAWRLLRGVHPVATSLDAAIERPADDSPASGDEARRRNHMRWDTWAHGLRTGIIGIPGRADIQLDDLGGALDVLGIALRADEDTQRDLEALLGRVIDLRLERPVVVTVRPDGASDAQRLESVARFRERLAALAPDGGVVRLMVLD